jgi:uncharacterized protein
MPTADALAPSPCVKVCTLDTTKSWCTGCYRTLGEIAEWRSLEVAERLAVLRAVEQRRAQWSTRADAPSASLQHAFDR